MTTKTKTDAVANIVSETLAQRFEDKFVFDPIIVEPEIDRDAEEYLCISDEKIRTARTRDYHVHQQHAPSSPPFKPRLCLLQ